MDTKLAKLKEMVKADFKKEFDFDLTDDDITPCEDGIEIDYRDYDLNTISKYHHSSLVDTPRFESDGRSEYVRVTSHIKFDEYL